MKSPIYIHVKVNLGLLNFPVSGRNWDQSDEYLKILFSLFLTFTEIVIIYEEVIFNLHWNRNMKKLEIYFWHMTRLQLAVPLLSNDVIKKSWIYMTSPNMVYLLKKRVNPDSVTLPLANLVRFLSSGAQITFILKLAILIVLGDFLR